MITQDNTVEDIILSDPEIELNHEIEHKIVLNVKAKHDIFIESKNWCWV